MILQRPGNARDSIEELEAKVRTFSPGNSRWISGFSMSGADQINWTWPIAQVVCIRSFDRPPRSPWPELISVLWAGHQVPWPGMAFKSCGIRIARESEPRKNRDQTRASQFGWTARVAAAIFGWSTISQIWTHKLLASNHIRRGVALSCRSC